MKLDFEWFPYHELLSAKHPSKLALEMHQGQCATENNVFIDFTFSIYFSFPQVLIWYQKKREKIDIEIYPIYLGTSSWIPNVS